MHLPLPPCTWNSELKARLAFFPCLWKTPTSIIPLLPPDPSNGIFLHWHAFQFGKTFSPFLHLPWKATVASLWCLHKVRRAHASSHTHAPTTEPTAPGQLSPHPALGCAFMQQAPEPCSVAATSCSKHALCFISRGGVVEAQGICYHKMLNI